MIELVIGGAASGKSAYAEARALLLAREPGQQGRKSEICACFGSRIEWQAKPLYIATMRPESGEAMRRIDKHRAARAGKGFVTIECSSQLAKIDEALITGRTLLLECLPNLLANEMFATPGQANGAQQTQTPGWQTCASANMAQSEQRANRVCGCVKQGLMWLITHARHMVIVSGDLFGGGWPEDAPALLKGDETSLYLQVLGHIHRELARVADRVTEVYYTLPICHK